MPASKEIRVLTTPQDVFGAAAEEISHLAATAVAERGRFTIALSGGSTPKSLYQLLAANARNLLPWDQMFFFFGDERHVPPTDPDSNFRMADEAMLSKIPVKPANIFRFMAENPDAGAVADDYEETLHKFFKPESTTVPRFDLILLGMGPDGHTASLFPATKGLEESRRWVIANWVEKLKTHRLSLTFPVLNAARCVTFLVCGADKAEMIHNVLEGDPSKESYPAMTVHPSDGKLIWMLDRAAASALTK